MKRGASLVRALRILGVAISLPALLLPAAPVLAAGVEFGTPAATVTYGTSIEFTVAITSGSAPERVELRLGFPDSLGPYIISVDPPGSGTQTLRHVMDLSGSGHIAPNTPIVVTWAAYQTVDAEPVLSQSLTVSYQDTTHDWRTVSGDLVTVHWYDGTDAFAAKALKIGDAAVRDTAALLGVTETKRIDFFIYGDETSFRAALGPGTRENVGGQAHSDIRTLFALITPDAINDPWVGTVIPHELVHLVFDTAVHNPYRFPPRWFNEGLAVYLSEGYGAGDRNRVEEAVRSADLLPLTALTGQFPTDADKTYLAYAESVSAIDYLVRTDGRDALLALVAAYHDGLTDDEAFTKALGRNLSAFQAGWLDGLGASEPGQYGPKPAPAGPLPPGWSGPGQTASPGSPSASATPASSGLPSATPGEKAPAGDGTAGGAVLAAILAVVVIVVLGLVIARRRAGSA